MPGGRGNRLVWAGRTGRTNNAGKGGENMRMRRAERRPRVSAGRVPGHRGRCCEANARAGESEGGEGRLRAPPAMGGASARPARAEGGG